MLSVTIHFSFVFFLKQCISSKACRIKSKKWEPCDNWQFELEKYNRFMTFVIKMQKLSPDYNAKSYYWSKNIYKELFHFSIYAIDKSFHRKFETDNFVVHLILLKLNYKASVYCNYKWNRNKQNYTILRNIRVTLRWWILLRFD